MSFTWIKTFQCLSMAFRVKSKLFLHRLKIPTISAASYTKHTRLSHKKSPQLQMSSLPRAFAHAAPSAWKGITSSRSKLLFNLQNAAQDQLQSSFPTFKLSTSVTCSPVCVEHYFCHTVPVPYQPVTVVESCLYLLVFRYFPAQ